MKLCVAGSRTLQGERGEYHVRRAVAEALKTWGLTVDDITEGVSGMAPGPDLIGYERFKLHGIPVREFPADWDDILVPGALVKERADGTKYNALAGPMRNEAMARYLARHGGRCVVVYDRRKTKGSRHMAETCKKLGVPVYEYVARD